MSRFLELFIAKNQVLLVIYVFQKISFYFATLSNSFSTLFVRLPVDSTTI